MKHMLLRHYANWILLVFFFALLSAAINMFVSDIVISFSVSFLAISFALMTTSMEIFRACCVFMIFVIILAVSLFAVIGFLANDMYFIAYGLLASSVIVFVFVIFILSKK